MVDATYVTSAFHPSIYTLFFKYVYIPTAILSFFLDLCL
jgi:hypothetical protein